MRARVELRMLIIMLLVCVMAVAAWPGANGQRLQPHVVNHPRRGWRVERRRLCAMGCGRATGRGVVERRKVHAGRWVPDRPGRRPSHLSSPDVEESLA